MSRFSRNRPSEGPHKRAVSVGRQSVAAGSARMRASSSSTGLGPNIRRSSGGIASSKPLTDTRNLSDRNIRAQVARDLHKFLLDNTYPYPIQTKDLIQGPSSTECWRLFEFLYRIVDEDFSFGNRDKPSLFMDIIKNLGYPFNISNSHMKTMGSPHSWPHLLGVLHWMVSPIRNICELDPLSQVLLTENLENPLMSIRWEFLERGYEAFMDGVNEFDDFIKEHEAIIKQAVHGPNGDAPSLKTELDRLSKKKEAVLAEGDPIEEAQKRLNIFIEDKGKLEKYINEKRDYFEKLRKITEDLDHDNANLKKQSATMEEDQKRLQIIYDNQEMTPADVQKINLERGDLRQRNKDLAKRKDALSEELGNKQMDIAKLRGETEKLVNDFSAQTKELRLAPNSADNAFGFDLSLSIATAVPDVVAALRDSLTHIQKALQDRSNNLEVEMLKLKESLEEWDDRLKTSQNEITLKQQRLESLDSEYEQRKKEVTAEMDAVRRLSDEASKEINELRIRLQHFNMEDVDIKESCRKEQAKFERDKKKRNKELEEDLNALTKINHLAIEHKEKMYERKKAALDKKKQIYMQYGKNFQDYQDWRKELFDKVENERTHLKRVASESLEAVSKAIENHNAFLLEFKGVKSSSESSSVENMDT